MTRDSCSFSQFCALLVDMRKNEINSSDINNDSSLLELADIRARLKMTYEERIEAHENARRLVEELSIAGENLRAKPQRIT